MLSKEDKEWIAKAISKIKSNSTTDDELKSRGTNNLKKQLTITAIKELLDKERQNVETFEEKLQLEKLRLQKRLNAPLKNAQKQLSKTKQALAKKIIPNDDARTVLGIGSKSGIRAAKSVARGITNATGTLAGGAISGTVGAARNTINAVKTSKLGSSAIEALMYSNPITAAIYMNKDLMKGLTGGVKGFIDGTKNILGTGLKAAKQLGGGLWQGTKEVGKGIFETASYFYDRNKNKYQPKKKAIPGQQQALIPGQQNALIPVDGQRQISQNNVKLFMAKDGTNYILTKTAIFMGGKNYLNVTTQPKKPSGGGLLPGPTTSALPGPNIPALPAPKLLPGPKSSKKKDDDIIEMTKGINGIYEQTKKSNKLLDKLGKKQLLIAVGVLAAVAGIAGLAVLISGFINKIKVPSTPKIDPTKQAESFREQATTPAEEIQNKIQEGINQEARVSKAVEFKKVTPEGLGPLGILGNLNTHMRSGYETQSKEGSIYRAPFNMKVKSWKENNKKLGIVNIIAEKIVPFGVNKDIEIMNVKEPVVFPEDFVERGQIIGLVGPTGKIMIKDISESDMDSYINMINNYVENYDKEQFEITPEIISKRKKYFESMARAKNEGKETAWASDTQIAYDEQQDKFQQNRYEEVKKAIDEANKNNQDGTYIYGRYIPKEQYQKTLDIYNQGNKNTEKAKQQAQQEKQKQQQIQKDKQEQKHIEEADKLLFSKPVTYHQSSKPVSKWFGPQESVDLKAMYQDKIGITDIN